MFNRHGFKNDKSKARWRTMTNYLAEFKALLGQLHSDERSEVINFYQEYLQDGGFTSYEDCVRELGAPRQLARKVLADYSIKASENPNPNTSTRQRSKGDVKTIWLIILALFSSPLMIPIAIVPIALLLAGIAVTGAIVVSVIAILLAAIFSGFLSLIVGIGTLFAHLFTGLFYLGIGLSVAGILTMLIPTFRKVTDGLIHRCTLFAKSMYHKIVPKNRAEKKKGGF